MKTLICFRLTVANVCFTIALLNLLGTTLGQEYHILEFNFNLIELEEKDFQRNSDFEMSDSVKK